MAGISTPAAFKRVNSVTFSSGQRMDRGYPSSLVVSDALLLNETVMPMCLYKQMDIERYPISHHCLCETRRFDRNYTFNE